MFMLCVLAAQQNYHFKKFSASEELSNTNVSDYFQDSYGFLWIATSDGLNRYDGNSVKIYKNVQGDVESLPDNATHKIVEDLDRNLWVACFNSIGKLDRKTDKFKRYSFDDLPFKSQPVALSAMLDNNGSVWFSFDESGLIRYDKNADKFVNIELSDNNETTTWGGVQIVIQLRNGVILAADAANGLKKYNSSIDKFDPFYLKPGYSPKKIFKIIEGSNGNVWISGSGKLIKYSPTQYTFNEINLKDYSRLKTNYHDHYGIVEDFSGNIWVSVWTHGLFMVDEQLENIVQYLNDPAKLHSISNNRIEKMYKDRYGIIWISYRGGGISQLDPNSNQFEFNPIVVSNKNGGQAVINSIEGTPNNKSEIIVGTNTDGLLTYDINSKIISKFKLNDDAVKSDSNNVINDFDIDYKGNIWFSINNSSLKKYDINTKRITTFESPNSTKTALPLIIASIDISPNNEIWVSSNQGVDIYNPQTNSFTSIPSIMNKKLSSELENIISKIRKEQTSLSSILQVGEGQNLEKKFSLDQNSSVIILGLGEGRADVSMHDRGSFSDVSGKVIWEMSDIYKTFYAGGGFKNRVAIEILDIPKGEYHINFSSDIGHSFGDWNVPAPPDSNYWGIEAYQISEEMSKKINLLLNQELNNSSNLPFEASRTVEFSNQFTNTVWIGTFTNSFFRYDLNTGKYKQYNFDKNNLTDASHFINTIYEDIDGIVWVGTYASLIRLNPQTNEFKIFSTSDGLPGGIISSLIEDNFGALWIYSSGGLSKLNKNAPVDEYVFVNYDNRDGIEGLIRSTAVWKNENGKLFFGGKGGVISFNPGGINSIKPDIVIYDFKIDDVSVFDDSIWYKLKDGIYNTEKIELSYFENDISFEFSSIHFSRPGKNKISYQLEGFSDKWYDSDRNFASFTNLDPGEYTFRVKGSNGDGVWNEKGRSISIVIHPPWWQTTWAYIGYVLMFLVIIFTIDRLQRRRLLAKAKERMKIQDAEHRAEAAELQSRAIQAENDRKTKELEEARELQLSMLPEDLPNLPNLDIAVYMQTATEVGGDYYDFHVGMDGTLTVVVGDATGHGMKAGTMVTTTKSLFNILAPNPDILTTFSEISRVIKGMKFHQLSMCLMLLKIKGDQLYISSAAMPPALIYREKNKTVDEIMAKGMPLGTMNNFPYKRKETKLNSGDTILLFSDGLPELVNGSEEMYGYDRTKDEFQSVGEKTPEEIVSHFKNSASQWVNGNDPDDDVTFVVIKVK